MAKRNNDQVKLVKINPINNSEESLIAIAILNALTILEAEKNELVQIPERKELTKLLKNAKLDNIIKALDEVNNIKIRKVKEMEDISKVGIVYMDHPLKTIPCLIYRDSELENNQFKIVNSGLGEDEIIINDEIFNNRLVVNPLMYSAYEIFLYTGTKNYIENNIHNCKECNKCYIEDNDESVCLYDNSIIDYNKYCNKFDSSFKIKGEK